MFFLTPDGNRGIGFKTYSSKKEKKNKERIKNSVFTGYFWFFQQTLRMISDWSSVCEIENPFSVLQMQVFKRYLHSPVVSLNIHFNAKLNTLRVTFRPFNS